MNSELAAVIILFGSLLGVGAIMLRKIPALVELPEVIKKPSGEPLWPKLKRKIKNTPGFKSFSYEIFLQKLLSRIRILTLKTDNKTSGWLQRLREKSRKQKLSDNYWEEIKKSTTELSSVEARGKRRTNSSLPKEK